MTNHVGRAAVICAVIALVALTSPPPAYAIVPPVVDPGPPPNGTVGPTEPTEQKTVCATTGVLPDTDVKLPPSAGLLLNYEAAWRFSRGAGQKVAVIDTGVSPHPRLHVEPGGDYVADSNGLQDCDAHGTLVAGIIAAAQSNDDGFSGVAPEATILSIRQNSSSFAPKGGGSSRDDPSSNSVGYGNTTTLAYAVTRAVDMGATVINLSEVACAPVGIAIDDRAVGRAVRYAFERNVVVVAAAGNVGSETNCKTQNDMKDPNLPLDTAWRSVSTIASPAWFSDYVLTVGALNKNGEIADFSLHGPWVGVAAPGENVASLASDSAGVINGVQGPQGLAPINGTSFAAPYVSGVVALVRARFPQLNAAQVIDLIKRTAHTPNNGPNIATGYGLVDPVAALTAEVPLAKDMPDPAATRTSVALPKPNPNETWARTVVLIVTAACVGLVVGVWALFLPRRRREEEAAPINDAELANAIEPRRDSHQGAGSA